MPGIAGGFGVDSTKMVSELCYRDYTKISTVSSEAAQFSVAHHENTRNSDWAIIKNGNTLAVVWGQAPATLNISLIQEAILDPLKLKGLDGSWALAAICGEKILIATDRMASRPIFYTEQSPIRMSSEIKGILPIIKKWSPDALWLMDFLTFDFGWGNRNIVEEIKALPPATALIADKKSYKIQRYAEWLFPVTEKPEDYVVELARRYKVAIETTLVNLPEELSIGFDRSGGLDSRVMASVAKNRIDRTFTYDDNPPGGRNPVIATEIAKVLGLKNERTGFGGKKAWTKILEDSIWATDSMKSWIHYHGVTSIWEKRAHKVDVMISVSGQGELFGEDIEEESLCMTPVDALLRRFQVCDSAIVRELFVNKQDWNPRYSLRSALENSEGRPNREQILCAVYDNFYPNFHYRGKPARSAIEIINLLVNCSLIDWIGAMPSSMRENRILKGRLPGAYTRLKLEMARYINNGIENISCERSFLSPKMPYLYHAAYFLAKCIVNRHRRHHTLSNIRGWMSEDGEFKTLIEKGLAASYCVPGINMEKVWEYWNSYQTSQKDMTLFFTELSTVGLWLHRAQQRFPSRQ